MVYDPPKTAEPWYCIRCKEYPPSSALDLRSDPPMHFTCESTCMRRPQQGVAAVPAITLPTVDGTVAFTPAASAAAPGPTYAPAPLPGFVDEDKMRLIAENAGLRSRLVEIQKMCATALASVAKV